MSLFNVARWKSNAKLFYAVVHNVHDGGNRAVCINRIGRNLDKPEQEERTSVCSGILMRIWQNWQIAHETHTHTHDHKCFSLLCLVFFLGLLTCAKHSLSIHSSSREDILQNPHTARIIMVFFVYVCRKPFSVGRIQRMCACVLLLVAPGSHTELMRCLAYYYGSRAPSQKISSKKWTAKMRFLPPMPRSLLSSFPDQKSERQCNV